MPKCPKCGEEIESLDYHVKEYRCYPVYSDGIAWEKGDTGSMEDDYFCCPECYAEIVIDEGEAQAFLRGP